MADRQAVAGWSRSSRLGGSAWWAWCAGHGRRSDTCERIFFTEDEICFEGIKHVGKFNC